MWVVKLGGSLIGDASLPEWLELLAQVGGGRVTIVCGGGGFADEVRRAQARWAFDDLSAHNMAVLAMAQSAWLLRGLQPALELVASESELRRVLHAGRVAVWLPFQWVHAESTPLSNWNTTGDSIALDLARTLNAERLVVVKSCAIDRALTLEQLGDAGVLDGNFAALARAAAFPIDLVHKSELAQMRALLIGERPAIGH